MTQIDKRSIVSLGTQIYSNIPKTDCLDKMEKILTGQNIEPNCSTPFLHSNNTLKEAQLITYLYNSWMVPTFHSRKLFL